MQQHNRRSAIGSMAGLWLSACGGGGSDDDNTAVSATQAQAAAPQTALPYPGNDASFSPAPPPAPAPTAPPPAPAPGAMPQYLVWDGGDGPTRSHWSRHLLLSWKNANVGDWIDADGTPQGSVPCGSALVESAPKWIEVDVTTLVRKAVTTGHNRGMLIRSDKADGVRVSGRHSANPPQLAVTMVGGARATPRVLAFAGFSKTASLGLDTRQAVRLSIGSTGIVQFDLAGLRNVDRAVLRIYAEQIWSGKPRLSVFECDAPRIVVGADRAPTMGLAAATGSERGLKAHRDVLRAGDFSDLTKGVVFDTFNAAEDDERGGASVCEQLPDPDAPGTTMLRGYFRAGSWNEGDKRGSCSFKTEHMRADESNLLRPPLRVEEEMFCRLYFFLEDDWNSTRDSNKMAIGWDLRMGWWNPAQKGYWQSVTGNGGAPGDGRRYTVPRKSSTLPGTHQYMYCGHSVRMEAGQGSTTGNPYGHLRPVQSYVYNLDQDTQWGDMMRLGSVCISKGRWFCIEQQVKMNSVVGPFDAEGNGHAVRDGVLRTWVDGVMCSEITNLRWRRHPQMGIQGPWINWFYGGKQPSEMKMHYRMNHFVVARRYIGPRVG